MTALIETTGLTRHYPAGEGVVAALQDVSLTIAPGRFVAAMGPSGSGKSTFLNLIGCLDRPTRGSYRLMDEEVGALSHDRLADLRSRRLGFVFQSFNLLPRADALANVELPLIYRGMPKRLRRERAAAALAAVGLADRMHHRPTQLSGGQQQRVAIARALVNSPKILVCDEPTSALDGATGQSVMELIAETCRGPDRAVVIVTHDERIFRFADRIAHMDDGRVDRLTDRDGHPIDGASPHQGAPVEHHA
jgi:putative ABC transport system ATP-binding protein